MKLSNLALIGLTIALVAAASADSIWPKDGTSMYADRKAAKKGDILTVVVQESAAASSTQSKESTRKSTVNDAVGTFLYPGLAAHAGSMPALSLSGASDYTGGGSINNTQSLNSQAAVLVTDVLPNGNMVIEGVRLVTFSGETQYVVLHGLVRPDDISSADTILSSHIAEAKVEFINKGQLMDAEKRGWLSNLYEKLRPF